MVLPLTVASAQARARSKVLGTTSIGVMPVSKQLVQGCAGEYHYAQLRIEKDLESQGGCTCTEVGGPAKATYKLCALQNALCS
jgi:hypothetical protein